MNLTDMYENDDVATSGKTTRILKQFRARYPEAQNDIEALLLHFNAGQDIDRRDISRLDRENDEEEKEIDRLEDEIEDIKDMKPRFEKDINESDSAINELSGIGRALMSHAAKVKDDELSNTLAMVGDALTRYGSPTGPRTIGALEKDTGLPRSTILKMMEFGSKLVEKQPAAVNENEFDMLDHQKRYFVRRLKSSKIPPERQIQIMAKLSRVDDLHTIDALHDKLDAMGVSDLGESQLREACRSHKRK